MSTKTKLSSRATERIVTIPRSALLDERYRQQCRQIDEILGVTPPKPKQSWVGDLLDMIAMAAPTALGILFLMWICGKPS